MITTNFDKDIPLLRSVGVEAFDIFTKEELAFLTDENYHAGNYNDMLAGHIKKEVELAKWPQAFEERLIEAALYSDITTNEIRRYTSNSRGSPLQLSRLWVNYQAKHEFNPIHNHDGVLSFVLFIKIPYSLKAEEAMYDANCIETSKLQFISIDHMGQLVGTHANVDQSYEGKMLMFNSGMFHTVYPFYTSDDYRITVSGNLAFDIDRVPQPNAKEIYRDKPV